jgi:hypothetical protein
MSSLPSGAAKLATLSVIETISAVVVAGSGNYNSFGEWWFKLKPHHPDFSRICRQFSYVISPAIRQLVGSGTRRSHYFPLPLISIKSLPEQSC